MSKKELKIQEKYIITKLLSVQVGTIGVRVRGKDWGGDGFYFCLFFFLHFLSGGSRRDAKT